jgi:addiction module HigA family antidote
MSISNTGIKRRPTHPGEMLREDFLPDYELTVSGLAEAIGVSRQSVNELLRERRAVRPEMALRLSRLFGNSPEFWLNAQRAARAVCAGLPCQSRIVACVRAEHRATPDACNTFSKRTTPMGGLAQQT